MKNSVEMYKGLHFVILLLLSICASGQQKVLFTIGDEEVYTDEFDRIYQKNKDLVIDEGRKDFESYFKLFVDYKLKLKQAKDLRLDTLTDYKEELANYREQLVQPFLQNPEAINHLVDEAYERTKYQVKASHILIRLNKDAAPADTLKAWNRINELKQSLNTGKTFEEVAFAFSEDPSAKTNKGDLGYFSAFDMVYSFENTAFSLEPGEVSEPIRTQFGYHLIKLTDKRLSPGEVEVAHIMIRPDTADPSGAERKINDIYTRLKGGAEFEQMARELSDDKATSFKGGRLPKFGAGRMIPEFETNAFTLQEEGQLSSPFKTDYGWHVIKLIKKYPIGSKKALRPQLETRIRNGSRAHYVEKDLANQLSKKYEVTRFYKNYLIDDNSLSDELKGSTVLQIEDQQYSLQELVDFGEQKTALNRQELYEEFVTAKIIEYHKEHLEYAEPEFKSIYAEYRDGLLLFALLKRVVWEKAENDSVGLKRYFEANRDNYQWKKRANLILASCTQRSKAKEVQDLLKQNRSTEEIKVAMNEGATIHVLFSKGTIEEGSPKLPEGFVLRKGVSEIMETGTNSFTIIKVGTIFDPKYKEFDEARGLVMNDYQNHLEEEWVTQLRSRYPITIDQKNYDALKNQYTEE